MDGGPVKNLAEFKRLATLGATLSVTNHVYPNLSGIRVVLKTQSTGIYLTIPGEEESRPQGSFLGFPKASECTFNEAGAIVISRPVEWGDPGPFCTIRVLEEGLL
jgi:hypothetical protein